MKIEFNEIQKFRQWWIWLLLSPLMIFTVIVFIYQFILKEPIGSKPLTDFWALVFIVLAIALLYLIYYLQLRTTINKDGVSFNYRPALNRNYSWRDIDRVEIIDYGFVGYGFRWWPKHGWIYNVGGSIGLKVYLANGKFFTIGTQNPEKLKDVLNQLKIDYSPTE